MIFLYLYPNEFLPLPSSTHSKSLMIISETSTVLETLCYKVGGPTHLGMAKCLEKSGNSLRDVGKKSRRVDPIWSK